MGEKYIFKWANDSINEVFKPLWLNDTTYHLPNHINAEVSWYETKYFVVICCKSEVNYSI
jgi:hypothetical protein